MTATCTLSYFCRNNGPILRCRHDSCLPWRCAGIDLQPQSHQRRTLPPPCHQLLRLHRKWLEPFRTRPSRALLGKNWRERGARAGRVQGRKGSGPVFKRGEGRKRFGWQKQEQKKKKLGHIGLLVKIKPLDQSVLFCIMAWFRLQNLKHKPNDRLCLPTAKARYFVGCHGVVLLLMPAGASAEYGGAGRWAL